MNAECLIEMLEERPFVPLRLHLSDGRKHDIRHPEMAIVTDEVVAVGLPRSDNSAIADRITNCATIHIVEVEPLTARFEQTIQLGGKQGAFQCKQQKSQIC